MVRTFVLVCAEIGSVEISLDPSAMFRSATQRATVSPRFPCCLDTQIVLGLAREFSTLSMTSAHSFTCITRGFFPFLGLKSFASSVSVNAESSGKPEISVLTTV